MGILIAKKYPTKLFLKAADHTYVECNSGRRGWGCWGGKTGGTAFKNGVGSTIRVDAIADLNERGGITCYLVNGVCHQAANRILLPASILVMGAHGYSLSSAIFGPYGKVGFSPCLAPFNQHAGSTGDLPQCLTVPVRTPKDSLSISVSALKAEKEYIESIKSAYQQFSKTRTSAGSALKFQSYLFTLQVKYLLSEKLNQRIMVGLNLIKIDFDEKHLSLVRAFLYEQMSPVEFILAFNQLTYDFQDEVASILDENQYRQLLDLNIGEKIILADPDIIERLYGKETKAKVFGNLR